MKKILSLLFVFTMFIATLSSCSSYSSEEIASEQTLTSIKDSTGIVKLKSDLVYLNNTYSVSQTRTPRWLRWLISGIVDVAAFIYDGSINGAATASKNVYEMSKNEVIEKCPKTPGEVPDSLRYDYDDEVIVDADIKETALVGLDTCSAGYMHNKIIVDLYSTYNDSIEKLSGDELYDAILTITEKNTGETLTEKEITESKKNINKITSAYNSDYTISEYVSEIKKQTDDNSVKEALDVCGLVMEGLQYVDDDDTVYIGEVDELIDNAELDEGTEKLIKDGVSIAYASAKLWNTDKIKKTNKNVDEEQEE